MESNQINYIKTDANRLINEQHIRWIEKINECLEVCTKSSGCRYVGGDTHRICKFKSFDSYNKLNQHFE